MMRLSNAACVGVVLMALVCGVAVRAQDVGGSTGVVISRRPENPVIRRRVSNSEGNRPVRTPPRGGNTSPGKDETSSPPQPESTPVNPQVEEALEKGNAARDANPPRYAEAEQAYQLVTVLNPNDARAYQGLGNIYYDQRRYAEAEPQFRRAVELAKRDTVTPFYLAHANNELGRYEEAEKWARRATELRPNEYYGYYLLALSKFRRKDFKGAEAEYKRAIDLSPETTTLYYDLSSAYMAEGHYKEAADVLPKALAVAPNDIPLLLNYALALQRSGQMQRAVEQYNQIIKIDPKMTGTRSSLGMIYYLMGDAAKARAEWETAIKLGTRRPLDLAGLQALDGAANEALPQLEQYVRTRPENEGGWLMLSDVRRALGDEEGAQAAYARGVELVPEYAKLTRPALKVKAAPTAAVVGADGGVDPKSKDANGFTNLMKAAAEGRTAAVESLISRGADVNAQDAKGGTALMYAAGQGLADVVRVLLAKGADANAKDTRGQTVLMYASNQNNPAVVQLLLEGKADVNAKTKSGATAMLIAKSKNRSEIVNLLKKAGAKG